MSRQKDSEETKKLKIRMTKLFVEAVETGGRKQGPKALEEAFAIGGGSASGIVWCAYRRGARSMPFPTLKSKIQMAVNAGYITKAKGYSLLSKLPQPTEEEGYTFDSRELFICDIRETVKLLQEQVRAYVNIMPENQSILNDTINPLEEWVQIVTASQPSPGKLNEPEGYKPKWWI